MVSYGVRSQNDSVAMESGPNIRLVARQCQSLFAEEVIDNISISTCIRRAEHRFLLWASFLGVYADEQRCLDTRLQKSPELRGLILLMLQVLQRNLEHVIAEPYEIRNDGRKGPVYGIDGALDRLHRLATIIRSEHIINETQHVHRLNSKRILDKLGGTVMTFIQKHFPEAPLSLQLQLSRSVLRRMKHFLYLRQQIRVTGHGNVSSRIPIIDLEAEACLFDPSYAYDGEPSASPGQRVAELPNNTDLGVHGTLQGLSLYPDPPSFNGGDEEGLCKLCSALLDEATIGSQEAWAKHVDHDLRPYVCVSEECEQTESTFSTPTDWRFHMEAVHSIEWPRYVHQARWACPYCQQDSVERTFTSAEEFSRHLTEGNTPCHCLSAGSLELTTLTVECKRYEPIERGDCPLCKSYVEVDGHGEVEDFYDHFIQHLRFVAFKGIDIWETQTTANLNQHASADAERRPSQLSDDEDKYQISSPSPGLPNDTLSDHFRAEMDRVSITGVDGKDQVAPYVPLSALEKYWTDERLVDILKTRAIQIPDGARFINQGYLRIFSTLVYGGFCDEISWFFYRDTLKVDDYDLPFDGKTLGHASEWTSSFLDHQWMFCPVELTDGYLHRQALDLRVILPVTYGEYLKAHRTGPDGAILRKVGFNFGFDSSLSMGEHVIFKVYEGNKGEARYNAETDAYIRFQKLSDDSIAKCFASFHYPEVKKFIVVLEYAEGGSLTEYLEENLPPTTPEDLLLLWKPMFSLTEGLEALNAIYQQNPRSPTFVGVHQEINPENILVFPKGKGTSRFDVQLKFKDFGMAASGDMSASDKRLRLGNIHNGFYVSPETFKFAIHSNSVAAISRLADVWSLGALFSDFLVWTITGTDGQEKYRLQRRAEILHIQQVSNPAYDSCFHNGENRLKAIDDVHAEALEYRESGDFLSPAISDLILDYMLVEPRDRLDAIHVYEHAARKLKEYQKSLDDSMLPILHSPDIEPRHPSTQSHQLIAVRATGPSSEATYTVTLPTYTAAARQIAKDHFHQHITENLRRGINGDDEAVPYILPSALDNYWTGQRVNTILDSQEFPVSQNSTMIISDYCRVFSILTYIGQAREILWLCSDMRGLDDSRLPFDEDCFPSSCKWASDFLLGQWMFMPHLFPQDQMFSRVVHPKAILPVTYKTQLTQEHGRRDTAILWEVEVHPGASLTTSEDRRVVFKVYDGAGAEKLYQDETYVYRKLRANTNEYITKNLASFSFKGRRKHIIVLEYAAGGSLRDFFHNAHPPVTPSEFRLLWSRLTKLLEALHLLQSLCQPGGSLPGLFTWLYALIQPANILVFPQKGQVSPFDVKFKFTDLGFADTKRASTLFATRGSNMYISPESFANLSVQDNVRAELTPMTGIWAMGAIFSDVLVWSICGEPVREEYRARRSVEISNHNSLNGYDPTAYFHDGEVRVAAVEEFHKLALQHKSGGDDISRYMSEIILDHMLTGANERLTAMQIMGRAKMRMEKIEDDLLNEYWRARTPVESQVPRYPEPVTKVTVDQVYQMMEKTSLSSFPSSIGIRSDKAKEIMKLPGMEEARRRIELARGRDQIMLIDNFESMRSHKPRVVKTAKVISYVAKAAGNHGMELYAASEVTRKPRICKTSSQVEKAVFKMPTVDGTCNMRLCLETILDRVLVGRKVKSTSIYVYTDGVWEPGDDQVKFSIKRAIDYLIKCRQPSSTLMIHFVQFGSDIEGTDRLRILDDRCVRDFQMESYDIVVTRHCDNHVPTLVEGYLSGYVDTLGSDEESRLLM